LGFYFSELSNLSTGHTMTLFFNVGWLVGFLLSAAGLASSFFHLKVPLHAWRGMANLKTSWLSREILFATLYTGSMFVMSLLQFFPAGTIIVNTVKWTALIAGLAMLFCMGSAYRLRTVKFWDSLQTIVSFYTSAVISGLLICGTLGYAFGSDAYNIRFILIRSGGILAMLILLNLFFSYNGFIRLISGTSEPFQKIKKMFVIRTWLGILAASLAMLLLYVDQPVVLWVMWPVIAMAALSELSGRVLFYAAQVPYGVYLLKG